MTTVITEVTGRSDPSSKITDSRLFLNSNNEISSQQPMPTQENNGSHSKNVASQDYSLVPRQNVSDMTDYSELLSTSSCAYQDEIKHDLSTLNVMHKPVLQRILEAYSVYDAQLGYCKNFIYLVTPLLKTMPENQVFSIFVRLMEKIRILFLKEKSKLRSYQFDVLVSKMCPAWHQHFKTHDISSSMFGLEWWIEDIVRQDDFVFVLTQDSAVETITRVTIGLLLQNSVHKSKNNFKPTLPWSTNVMQDAMALMPMITQEKMNAIAAHYEQQQHHKKVQQLVSMRLDNPHIQKEILADGIKQLEMRHTELSDALRDKNRSEMEWRNLRDGLLQRNKDLEEQIQNKKKSSKSNDIAGMSGNPTPVASEDGDSMHERWEGLQTEEDFKNFVDSLKQTGDFGALVADGLATKANQPIIHDVTSELISFKLANFEIGLKYQDLCHTHSQLQRDLESAQEGQADLLNKIVYLQEMADELTRSNSELIQETDDLRQQSESLKQKTVAAKLTSKDIQLEKLALDQENQALKDRVEELEKQRQEYLKPRDSFVEEVFAAHKSLFGGGDAMQRRHTVQVLPAKQDQYQSKYIDSDLRCRELEKMLAEAKVKLAEYESSSPPSSPLSTSSKRNSYSSFFFNRRSITSSFEFER
ncbi:hypothetical protein K501DRAFT_334005 [Backusella circina FSU 941]|nr:hypothetical protein K501DRAFT_334005 [Backusella circina FSU 941]